jgi:hypothetical protein
MHGWGSSRLRVEPIFVRFDGEVGFCFVLEELMIFESVVLSSLWWFGGQRPPLQQLGFRMVKVSKH